MITQLLTTALLAVSLNNTPKRVIGSNNPNAAYGSYSFSYVDNGQGNLEYSITSPFGNDSDRFEPDVYEDVYLPSENDWSFNVHFYFSDGEGEVSFSWAFDTASRASSFFSHYVEDLPTNSDDYGEFEIVENYSDGSFVYLTFNAAQTSQGSELGFSFSAPTIYNVTKTFNNCHDSGNTDYRVPDSFTSGSLNNPYTILVVANDGYFFKTDGSCYSFSSGVVVSSVQYGANPTAPNVAYSEMMFITFSMPASDVSMTFTASPATLAELNGLYNQGYQDAKAIYENTNQFSWLKSIWSGMAGFFAIEILPNISLGFLAFAPLLVVAIIAIVRILKHD